MLISKSTQSPFTFFIKILKIKRNNKYTKVLNVLFIKTKKKKTRSIEAIKEKHLSNLSNELLKIIFFRISNLLMYNICHSTLVLNEACIRRDYLISHVDTSYFIKNEIVQMDSLFVKIST